MQLAIHFRACVLTFATVAFMVPVAVNAGTRHSHGHDQIAKAEPQISIKATKLNDTLTMLSGAGGFTGGNVVVSNGEDGMLIIDDKLKSMSAKLNAALEDIGGHGNLKFVINTHWHFDHAGNNAELGKRATIVAHTNVRERLSTKQRLDAFDMVLPPSPKSALPVITYDDSVSIHFNGEELELLHYPASHTDTDSVVYFSESNVLHTGDLFFNGIFPFIDIQNGGDVENMTDSVADLIDRFPEDARIVPGHGPLATMSDLKQFHIMLTETTAHVEEMIKGGKSLEQAKAAGLPSQWDSWAGLIDVPTWITIVYSSLTK